MNGNADVINPSGPPSQMLPPGLVLGPILLEIKDVLMGVAHIAIMADVVDRDNPYFTKSIQASFARLGMESDADLLRRGLKTMVCHEVDEQIQLNGYRIFDPHDPRNVERHY